MSTHARLTRAIHAPLVVLAIFWSAPLIAQTATTTAVDDAGGFIYGRVTTSVATYEGLLRWGNEEAFWGDHFNGTHDTGHWSDAAYSTRETGRQGRRREPLKLFGITIGLRWDDSNVQHLTALRFGDIERLDIDNQDVTVRLKGGEDLVLDGGSNDIGAKIRVLDPTLGAIEINWDRIERIVFLPLPAGSEIKAPTTRLFGTLISEAGTFTGFIQWDLDECLATDVLDGESADGDHEIPMGQLATIERRTRSSARVTFNDGRTLVLDGTKDVDHRNSGIFVETNDLGRVLVSWDAFERLDFSPPPNSGPTYDSYAPTRPLHARIATRDGQNLQGRMVYDLDESSTAEILNGEGEGVEYHIPFSLISRIEPLDDSSRITLVSGTSLHLDGVVDVDNGNSGILIFESDQGPAKHIPWRNVAQIDFRPN